MGQVCLLYQLSCMFYIDTFMLVQQHLLFSVTDPQYRTKPAGVSDVSSLKLCWNLYFLCSPALGLY